MKRGGLATLVAGLLTVLPTAPALARAGNASTSKRHATDALAQAARAIRDAEAPVKWSPPGPAIAASKVKGDTVVLITNGQNAFTETVGGGMVQAGKAAGLHVVTDYTTGTLSEADTGIGNAISTGAKAIAIMSFESSALQAPLAQAAKHGIKIIQIGEHGAGPLTKADVAAGVVGNVASCYACAGNIMADFVAVDSHGKGHVLFLNAPDVGDANIEAAAFAHQLHSVCPGCALKTDQIPIPDWSSQLPSAVSSALVADSHLDYIVPVFDIMYTIFSSAIGASGATNRVKLVSYNASLAEMKLLKSGAKPTWVADGGYNELQLGWAVIDQILRALVGAPPIRGNVVENRFFTPSMAKRLDLASEDVQDSWYGKPTYRAGFLKLWGLKG